MSQVFGRATITVNGQVINSKPGASFDPGGVTRSTQTSDQQSDYAESLRPAKVMCEINFNEGVSAADLSDVSGATVQFIADTGQNYVLSNAWRVGELEVSGGDNGGARLEFHANRSVEVGV